MLLSLSIYITTLEQINWFTTSGDDFVFFYGICTHLWYSSTVLRSIILINMQISVNYNWRTHTVPNTYSQYYYMFDIKRHLIVKCRLVLVHL